MAWSGKVLGGLVGGMVGGPLGAGVGAAVGHFLADGTGAARSRELVALRLLWQHHAFSKAGPGVRVTPVWSARNHRGRDVRVRLDAGPYRETAVVTPEEDEELCQLPEFFLPYADLDGTVRVRLDSTRVTSEPAEFDVELPTRVRQLGGSGPARIVMALLACARAGGRALDKADIRFVRESFTAAYPLDADGIEWLRGWMRELRDADVARLTPEKVAKRLERHLAGDAPEELLLWLMRGARDVWPGPAAEAWIAAFGDAVGLDTGRVARLWRELDTVADFQARAEARRVLGVSEADEPDVVRAAWRRLVREWHPDRAQGEAAVAEATRRVAEINAAWRVLREE